MVEVSACLASLFESKSSFLKSIHCSGPLLEFDNLPPEDKLAFLSDLGQVKILKKHYFICENHQRELNTRLRNRLRRQYCDVPKPFSAHEDRRKKERQLQFPAVEKIWAKIGVVIPVGTGICKACRTSLLGNTSDTVETYQHEAGDSTLASTVSHCPSVPGDNYISTTDHIPAKRARKEIATCDDELGLYENMLSSTQEAVDSQLSEASACGILKLEALNKFLSVAGTSPVKELHGSIIDASTRTQQRYIEKAKQCVNLVFNTLCPNEGDFLMSEVLKPSQCDCENVTLSCLVEIYKRADTWTLQRQILSIIVAQHSYEDIQKLIPDITQFRYKKARKHSIEMGAGNPVPIVEQHRQKFDNSQLDHFIDFITSGHVIKDLPFGEKTIKLTSGEVIRIPAVIRSLAPAKIISQYTALCSEEDVRPLGTSTMHKILEECSALVRKSIEGLDNFIMEGCRGFTDLEAVLDLLDIEEESRLLKEGLLEGKRYLKSELKAHVVRSSAVPDHCMSFALSLAGEPDYSVECEHSHSSRCKNCDNLELVLDTIREKVESKLLVNKEAVMYKVEEAVQAIHRWKAHIVRSKTQEEARSSLVENMTDEDVLITCDWAMKFLPRKYREGQVDWFAKRGLNWHVAVSLLKQGSTFLTFSHIHIFDSPIAQDAHVTSEVLADVSQDIVQQHPRIKHIHFMSDNAGCYKSSLTLFMLHNELGEQMASYNFCEAQNGKGPCDRRAANVKGIIRRYVNEGHDVTSALQMKQAIDKDLREDIKVKIVAPVNLVDSAVKSKKTSIQNISQLHNFQYDESGLKFWRAFKIGEGKLLKWDAVSCPAKQIELQTVLDWDVGKVTRFDSEEQEAVPGQEDPVKITKSCTFSCPNEGCSKHFISSKYLDEHILLGRCSTEDDKVSVGDAAKFLYSKKLLSLFPSRDISFSSSETECCYKDLTKMGWALKENKARVLFSDSQKHFMMEKFNIGKNTGRKVDPYSAAEEMRTSGQFKRAEFLSGQQISSFFSRLCQNEKKTTSEDYEAAEFEDTKQTIKLTAQNLCA